MVGVEGKTSQRLLGVVKQTIGTKLPYSQGPQYPLVERQVKSFRVKA